MVVCEMLILERFLSHDDFLPMEGSDNKCAPTQVAIDVIIYMYNVMVVWNYVCSNPAHPLSEVISFGSVGSIQ